MYISHINPTTKLGSTNSRIVARNTLQKVSDLKNLEGYTKKEEAEACLATYTIMIKNFARKEKLNEMHMLFTKMVMSSHILNSIYKFNLSKSLLNIICMKISACISDKETMKLMSNTSWLPFATNQNEIIATSICSKFGAELIKSAEFIDRANKNGKKN